MLKARGIVLVAAVARAFLDSISQASSIVLGSLKSCVRRYAFRAASPPASNFSISSAVMSELAKRSKLFSSSEYPLGYHHRSPRSTTSMKRLASLTSLLSFHAF